MSRAKLAIIVHRWGGTPESDWYPWLKGELETRGYDVLVPAMPDTDEPRIDAWTAALGQLLTSNPAVELLLVGHSIGCQTILRVLARSDINAQAALFVAGWVRLSELDEQEQVIAEPWLTNSIDTVAIKAHLERSVAVFSRDDPLVPLSNRDFFQGQIGSRIVVLDGYGHFDEGTDTTKVPELLSYI